MPATFRPQRAHKSGWSVCFVLFFACVSQTCKEKKKTTRSGICRMTSKRLCLPPHGWFSIRVVENTMIFSLLSRYFPETFEMNFARLKREMNCFFCFVFSDANSEIYTDLKKPRAEELCSRRELCRRNEKSSQSRIKGSIQAFMQQRRIGFFFFFGFLWEFLV